MKPCTLLIAFATLVIPWAMPSNADACAPTPLVHEISLSDEGNAFPECLDIEVFNVNSNSNTSPYIRFDNACDEIFQLELLDGDGLEPGSLTVEPGETGNLTAYGSDSMDSTYSNSSSASWKLGEGEENSAQVNTIGYYPDWDTCPGGCTHHRGNSPLLPLALMLLGTMGLMALFKRRFSL